MDTGELPGGSRLKQSMVLPIVLAAIVYLLSTTNRGVTDYDEGYYAQAAKGMAESGDWVTPYVNGVRFLEKPPFLYWLTASSFRVFGINEYALRLPTAFALIALVWVMTLLARRLADERTAMITGLSTAFSAGTFLFTRETLHDVWLVLFLALAMYGFVAWYLDPLRSRRPAMIFFAATAGAVMCKSLVGLVFPLGIVAVFLLISRELPKIRTLHLLPGSLLFLILTVPWHWLAAVRNQGFLDFFFVGEQFLRFFGRREPPVLWSLPVLAFWALVLVWLFPWTAFLPAAVAANRKQESESRRILVRLALSWAGVILVFFSISGRLEHYAFPALPAFSLFIAAALSRSENKWILWAFRGLAISGLLAVLFVAGAGIWFAAHDSQFSTAGPSNRLAETDFSILAEMPPVVVWNLFKPAAATAIVMAAGFWIALWFETRHRRIEAVIALSAVMMVVCGAIHWSLRICEDLISSKKFAVAVAKEAHPGDRLVVVGDYESANSMSFYAPLQVQVYDGLAYALIPGLKYPDAPKIVLTSREFQAAWRSGNRVFALVHRSKAGELKGGGIGVITVLHRTLIRNH